LSIPLGWDDLINARDLGGLRVPGGRVRPGALIRSDSLARLTEAGRAALLAHGVTTIVDLRMASELARWPNPLRSHPGFRSLPLVERVPENPMPEFDSVEASYLDMLETFGPRVAAIVRGIAGAPTGGVLVHCAAGKDRTGVVVALALSVAGVDRSDIAEDYALSRTWDDRMLEEWLLAQPASDRDRMRRLHRTRPETILATLAALDDRYGGVTGYLAAIGIEDGVLERLRRRLVS